MVLGSSYLAERDSLITYFNSRGETFHLKIGFYLYTVVNGVPCFLMQIIAAMKQMYSSCITYQSTLRHRFHKNI